MAQLIKNDTLAVDTWKTLELAEGETPETVALPAGDIIFPLAVWQARKTEIISCHKRIGLLIQPDELIEDVAGDLEYFIVIAVNFPKFVDGRGYSTASLLRQRYRYEGELRAVGDVLHDQLFFMRRVGFDSYALKDGKNAVYALEAGFNSFSDTYQTSTSQPQPYFRRRA
ncbi:oxidoreductase [Dechloromonas denitrificans]|uniref:Oxidoreductase n=1 Tax=Dechloromonas denitrificans TaxID=281362 RepID=A0A133XNR5_9RHOO|nr:DUF934 domain-containing protein [Dechloromonas denitrificans]KXB32574.1 oxidoreductase [Dechloromonas denitrificans]